MANFKYKYLVTVFSSALISVLNGCGLPDLAAFNEQKPKSVFMHSPVLAAETNNSSALSDGANPVCPEPNFTPSKVVQVDPDRGNPVIDLDQEIKDAGTTFVVSEFFNSKETLFNFMKLVYGNIDDALNKYKSSLGLADEAIFLLFKGGNILRMVAQTVFSLVSPEAREFLEEKYSKHFKRSDADFSVYVDEQKLQGMDYDRIFAEVNEIVFSQLNAIRMEFQSNPKKYFDFFKLDSAKAQEKLGATFEELQKISSLNDPENPDWYQATFKQLQILDNRVKQTLECSYFGQFDTLTVPQENNLVRYKLSRQPSWIANSDNRTIQFPWGSDENKLVKFFLLRSKVAFEVFYDQHGEYKRKPMVGELIDVSLPHREDDRLRPFLNHFERNVSTYVLQSEDKKDSIKMRSYSLHNLAEDLRFIIFDSFMRPWEGGPKYDKRLNRLFFLHITEMLAQFGLGSEKISSYVQEIRNDIIKPLENLYPIREESKKIAAEVSEHVEHPSLAGKRLEDTQQFWVELAKFVQERLVLKPKEGDEKAFQDFLNTIKENLDNAEKLGHMSSFSIDPSRLEQIDIENLL